MEVSVIVGTFGPEHWVDLANARAIPSATAEGVEVIHRHGATIAEARNAGAAAASSEWLVFLDADDELEPGYIAAMAAADGDLRAPAVRYVTATEHPDPIILDGRNIDRLNPCVIGTALRRDMFDFVGGFWNERAWEDWSLFRRCWLAGAKLVHVPTAVYRAHVNPTGRNNTVSDPVGLSRHIRRRHAEWRRSTLR